MASYKDQNTLLDQAIARLERERQEKYDDLKNQFDVTVQSFKPMNILKGTLDDLKQFPEVKSNIVQLATSLAGGYLSKKLLIGKSSSIFKKIAGYLLQYGVTNFISKKVHPNT
ncbi:hypothetical protein [Flavobacterium seoulense]|uniref:Uncharacterized protein n=1 Tax=Flavobacterium seoulense TaxID=1492738 RepID=A0A066WL15_9FLAO|nr:hypothetical protein [Flavobacterium seoulense]KDN54541.1 hypothetical protein FEM21_22640 [Flavobacterium seoulense]